MPLTRVASETVSLPVRQNRLEVKSVSSRWRQSVELSQLFAAILTSPLAEILSAGHTTTFSRKQAIFFAGEKIQRVIMLTEGSIKIKQIDEYGRHLNLLLPRPGRIGRGL